MASKKKPAKVITWKLQIFIDDDEGLHLQHSEIFETRPTDSYMAQFGKIHPRNLELKPYMAVYREGVMLTSLVKLVSGIQSI